MKKIVSIMLMLALAICCMGITSFATNSSNHEQEINTLIEELSPFIEKNSNNHLFSNINDPRILGFIESLKPFFEDPKNQKVLTSDEVDTSNSLYLDCIDSYNENDYISIYEKWGNSVKYVDYLPVKLTEHIYQAQGINPLAAFVSKGVSIGNLVFIANAHTNFEFTISMSGNYTVNITDGIIASASNPSLHLVYYQYPTYGNCYIGIITRSASISSDKQNVTFTSKFRCYREYTMGGYDDCGLFQASLVGNTAGTLIGYSPVEYGYPI